MQLHRAKPRDFPGSGPQNPYTSYCFAASRNPAVRVMPRESPGDCLGIPLVSSLVKSFPAALVSMHFPRHSPRQTPGYGSQLGNAKKGADGVKQIDGVESTGFYQFTDKHVFWQFLARCRMDVGKSWDMDRSGRAGRPSRST